LEKGKAIYCGFDPTADSIHLGNLVQLQSLLRFAPHLKPVVVFGGATALIGDPSGKNKERNLLPKEQVQENTRKFQK